MNSWEFHHCSSEAICSKFLTRMVLRSPTKHQGGPYLPPLLIYSTDPSALDHHLDHTLPRTTVQSYPPHFETDKKWSISQRATFSTYHPPPQPKKNTAHNHAWSDFYNFCLLNAHQITSPFMHIISNYIPLPRVIHPSYISRDEFDFIDTIEGALPFTDFLASCQPLSSLHSDWLRIPYFKALLTFSSYILFSPSFALAHL